MDNDIHMANAKGQTVQRNLIRKDESLCTNGNLMRITFGAQP